MRIPKALIIAAVAVVAAGCNLLDVSTPTSSGGCPVSAVINAGVGFSDYKQRIPRQTAVAPPDSTVDVLLVFNSSITQQDRDAIATYGGSNVSSAGNAISVKAKFHAQDLPAYVANNGDRLSDAVIFIPECVTF
jgi:hypothetical protein